MSSHDIERDLTKASVGYLSKEDYKRKREELESEKALAALKRMANGPAPTAAAPGAAAEEPSEPASEKKKKKKAKNKPSMLTFENELEEEEEAASPSLKPIGGMAAARAKDAHETAQRQEAAMREALDMQRKAAQEPLTLTYSFRSAVTQRELTAGVHKGSVVVRRGMTADEVAVAVRTDVEALGGKFAPNAVQGIKEERDVCLVLCSEGMEKGSFLVPGAVKLTELWARRWSDLPAAAASIFDEFKFGVVVCERRWYEEQRHTHPYVLWRQYDTLAEYSNKEFIATRDQPAYKFEIKRESASKAAANTKGKR